MKALSRSRLPDIDYTFNPYVGCAHGCIYCYARCFTRDKEASERWGEVVKVKRGIIEALKRDLASVKRGSIVGVSTITDPYQPLEERLKITRRAVEIMLNAGLRVSIQTKSDLVLRDLDVFEGRAVDVGFTITTMDEKVARIIEPKAPSPKRRAQALKVLADRGIERWLFYGPIIPKVNDDEDTVAEIAGLASETETEVILDYLRLRPKVLRSMKQRLDKEILDLAKDRGAMLRRILEIKERMAKMGVKASLAFPQAGIEAYLRQ